MNRAILRRSSFVDRKIGPNIRFLWLCLKADTDLKNMKQFADVSDEVFMDNIRQFVYVRVMELYEEYTKNYLVDNNCSVLPFDDENLKKACEAAVQQSLQKVEKPLKEARSKQEMRRGSCDSVDEFSIRDLVSQRTEIRKNVEEVLKQEVQGALQRFQKSNEETNDDTRTEVEEVSQEGEHYADLEDDELEADEESDCDSEFGVELDIYRMLMDSPSAEGDSGYSLDSSGTLSPVKEDDTFVEIVDDIDEAFRKACLQFQHKDKSEKPLFLQIVQLCEELPSSLGNQEFVFDLEVGILQNLIGALSSREIHIQHKVCDLLRNSIKRKEHTDSLMEAGALADLVELVMYSRTTIARKALEIFGRILQLRGEDEGIPLPDDTVGMILSFGKRSAAAEDLAATAWIMKLLCKNESLSKPFEHVSEENVATLWEAMTKFLEESSDEKILGDLSDAFVFLLCSEDLIHLEQIRESGVPKRFCKLLYHANMDIVQRAVQVFFHVAKRSRNTTCCLQVILDSKVFDAFRQLLNSLSVGNHSDLKVFITNIIARMAAGDPEQQVAILRALLLHPVVDLLRKERKPIQMEAVYVLSNLMQTGSSSIEVTLLKLNAFEPIYDILQNLHPRESGFEATALTFLQLYKVGQLYRNRYVFDNQVLYLDEVNMLSKLDCHSIKTLAGDILKWFHA